jgi:hypothetical protein
MFTNSIQLQYKSFKKSELFPWTNQQSIHLENQKLTISSYFVVFQKTKTGLTMLLPKICCFFALSFSMVYANIGPQGFIDHPNEYFVETGTFRGDGIARALRDGFKHIISLDIDAQYVEEARIHFKDYENVRIYCGDSATHLWPLIKSIDKPITFWLDGHNIYPTPNTKNCPLLEELDQIKNHPIKTHTLIIDDMHCLNTLYFDYLTRESLLKKILEINPNYKITYMVGGDLGSHPDNIMVAKVY